MDKLNFSASVINIHGDDIGVSNLVDYCPLYSSYGRNIIEDSLIYYKPVYDPELGMYTRYEDLLNFLFLSSAHIMGFQFIYNENTVFLNIGKGFILDHNSNILLMFAIKSDKLFSRDGSFVGQYSFKDRDTLDIIPENMKLFISTALATEEIYTNIHKRLDKEVIKPSYDCGIAVEFTTSRKIQDAVYQDGLELDFNSLNELNLHLKEDVPSIFDYEENLYNVFSNVSLE